MSFIYDDNKLINLLTRVGDEFTAKYGQTVAANPNAYSIGSVLANNLQREIDPASAGPSAVTIGTENNAQPNLTALDAKSLGDFLRWLSENRVTWQGGRIAWITNPTDLTRPEGTPDDAWLFQDANQAAYAVKDKLVSLLSFLRDSAESKANRVLQNAMAKIINQVNETLVKENEKPLDTRPKAEENKSDNLGGLNPEGVVDGFASSTLDPNDPFRVVNAFPLFPNLFQLKIKDLSSFGAFTSWLKNLSLVTKSGTVPVVDPKGDPCAIVHMLYKRAQWLSQYAASAEKAVPGYSKMVAMYQQKIVEYGRQLHGPDGKACSVSSEGTSASTPGAQSGDQSVASINRLIQSVPLRMRDISFPRIEAFFTQYQGIVGDKRGAGVQTAITNARTAMQNIQAGNSFLINPSMDTFSLSASPGEVKTWLRPPQGKYYLSFLDHLKTVLSNTVYVIRDLQNSYGDDDRLDAGSKNILAQQVGAGMGSGSIYGNNWNQITRLESAVQL